MSYNENHYKMDEKGLNTQAEAERAAANGHLVETSNGYWDKQTGKEYWKDGTEK